MGESQGKVAWPVVPAAMVRLSDALDELPAGLVWATCLLLTVATFAADSLTGPETAWSIVYAVPVGIASWRFGWRPGFLLALLGGALWLAADVLAGAEYAAPAAQYWNAVTSLSYSLVIAYILSALRLALQQERQHARTDWLTALPNARSFVEAAAHEIARARRTASPLTLAYIDLDGFKAVNDALGHAAGDDLLRTIAREMRRHLREVDIVARLGGDEFAVLLPDTARSEAEKVLDRLHSAMGEVAEAGSWAVRFSVGAVTCAYPTEVSDLIRRADVAMYEAKQNGGDRSIHVEIPAT